MNNQNHRVSEMINRKFAAVVIGGSWGGMAALIKIVRDLPENFPVPLIAILHRQKYGEGDLVRVLKKYVLLPVKEIEEKEKITPGTIYIAPPNYHVLIEKGGSFSLCASENVYYSRPSISVTFESVALAFKEKVIGILVSGANADGSDGLKTISEFGGLTIIQDPEEAESPIMPLSALNLLNPDFIFTKQEINEFLLRLI